MSADGDTLIDARPADAGTAYDRDFHAWLMEQAAALRGENDMPLDLEHLAEEIEGLANRDRREIVKRLTTLMEHILKHSHGMRREPAKGWQDTISRERDDISDILAQSPSLRRAIEESFPASYSRARKNALRSFEIYEPDAKGYRAALPVEPSFTLEQALDHDFLPAP